MTPSIKDNQYMNDVTVAPSPTTRISTTDGPSGNGSISYNQEDIARFLATGSLDKPADLIVGDPEDSEEDLKLDSKDESEEQTAQLEEPEQPEQTEEKISKKTFQKRLNKEVAKSKALADQLSQVQSENHQLIALIKTLQQNEDKFASAKTPSDAELLQYKMQEQMQSHLKELQEQYEQKAREAEKQAKIDLMTETLLEEVDSATKQYPLAHPQDILSYAAQYPKYSIAQIAKELDKQMRAKSGFNKVSAVAPVSKPMGSSYIYSEDSIADFLRHNR
jgi:hypothetical protein